MHETGSDTGRGLFAVEEEEADKKKHKHKKGKDDPAVLNPAPVAAPPAIPPPAPASQPPAPPAPASQLPAPQAPATPAIPIAMPQPPVGPIVTLPPPQAPLIYGQAGANVGFGINIRNLEEEESDKKAIKPPKAPSKPAPKPTKAPSKAPKVEISPRIEVTASPQVSVSQFVCLLLVEAVCGEQSIRLMHTALTYLGRGMKEEEEEEFGFVAFKYLSPEEGQPHVELVCFYV